MTSNKFTYLSFLHENQKRGFLKLNRQAHINLEQSLLDSLHQLFHHQQHLCSFARLIAQVTWRIVVFHTSHLQLTVIKKIVKLNNFIQVPGEIHQVAQIQ